jgi:hypothetical protein
MKAPLNGQGDTCSRLKRRLRRVGSDPERAKHMLTDVELKSLKKDRL